MKPSLLAQPYAHFFADILHKFEDGRPLNSDQLNFLLRHEKTLSSHALDPVIKYYLSAAKEHPKEALSLTFPKQKINATCVHQIKDTVKTLLNNHLNHVDLKMTLAQFMQFKAAGFNELIFWHGHQFLTHTVDYCPGAIPQLIYMQWGRMFGVVKLNVLSCNESLEGNVLIYFEDMDKRNLYDCVKDYSESHKLELDLNRENTLIHTPYHEETLIQQPAHALPTLRPAGYEILHQDHVE